MEGECSKGRGSNYRFHRLCFIKIFDANPMKKDIWRISGSMKTRSWYFFLTGPLSYKVLIAGLNDPASDSASTREQQNQFGSRRLLCVSALMEGSLL